MSISSIDFCLIWGSDSHVYEDYVVLGCFAVYVADMDTFLQNVGEKFTEKIGPFLFLCRSYKYDSHRLQHILKELP
jgi:hypothetical protein